MLDARRTHGRTVTNRVLHSHNSSPVIAQLESFRPGHDSFPRLLSFHDEFRSNNNRVHLLFFLLAKGQFPLRVKGVSPVNFDLPSSPPEMFFPAIRIEIPLDKEGGGSIAGGDINGPRNFSPKEKINTSYYAPFALLLRSRANPSRLGTLARKFSSPSLLFRLLFHLWERLETMNCPRFSRRCVIIARQLYAREMFYSWCFGENRTTFSTCPTLFKRNAFDSGKDFAAKSSPDLFFSPLLSRVLLYLSKRYTPKKSSTSRSGLIRKGCPFPWIIARWFFSFLLFLVVRPETRFGGGNEMPQFLRRDYQEEKTRLKIYRKMEKYPWN